jgi:hypothetical protein
MTGTGADPMEEGYGEVLGFARLKSGEPVAEGSVEPLPGSPVGLRDICWLTRQDGSYLLPLPAQTYTIQVFADSPSGSPLFGEVTGVLVTAGQQTRAPDIVVTDRPTDPK